MVGQQEGRTVLGSGGGGPGFRSTQKIFPDDRVAFVVLTNLGAAQIPNQPDQEQRLPAPTPERPAGEKKKRKSPPVQPAERPNPVREMEQLLTEIFRSHL